MGSIHKRSLYEGITYRRGTRLDRKMRLQVWNVIEEYQTLMKEKQIGDVETAMYECRLIIEKIPI